MISSVDSSSSGIAEMFFKNRFPEPKEEPLLTAEESKKSGTDTSISSPQNQSGAEQVNFSQAMQHAVQADTTSKEEQTSQKTDSKFFPQEGTKESQVKAYDSLRVKAHYNAFFWV